MTLTSGSTASYINIWLFQNVGKIKTKFEKSCLAISFNICDLRLIENKIIIVEHLHNNIEVN